MQEYLEKFICVLPNARFTLDSNPCLEIIEAPAAQFEFSILLGFHLLFVSFFFLLTICGVDTCQNTPRQAW